MGLFSSSKERAIAAASLAQAKAMAEKAGMVFEELDTPTQQQILGDIQQHLESLPPEEAEQIYREQMEMTQIDPELYESQKDALARLTEMGEVGLTPEEEMNREMLMNEVASQEQARQKGIVQEMQQRGTATSGVEAALRAQSSQSAANRAREEAMNLAAQRDKRALEGITQQSNLAGQMRGQEMQKASAIDAIQQFNAAQRTSANQRNTDYQRQIAQQKVDARDKAYGYEMDKAKSQAGAYTGQAQMLSDQAAAQTQAAASKSAATMGLIGSALGAGATAYKASDVRAKENIKPGKGKINEMLDNIAGYEYDYKEPEKHGEGKQVGVMAQDLEKSDLGKEFVVNLGEDQGSDYVGDEPTKGIDYGSMAPTIVAAQAELNKDNKNLKDRVKQLENMLNIFRGKKEELE